MTGTTLHSTRLPHHCAVHLKPIQNNTECKCHWRIKCKVLFRKLKNNHNLNLSEQWTIPLASSLNFQKDDLQKLYIRTQICYWACNSEVAISTKQFHRAEKILKIESWLCKQLWYTDLKTGKHKQRNTDQELQKRHTKNQVQTVWPDHGMLGNSSRWGYCGT